MLLPVYRKLLVLALLAVLPLVITCSDKQSEPPQTAGLDTAVARSDSVKSTQNIRMVVGGILPEGEESLLPIDPATFRDWKVITYENFRLLCPQEHAHAANVDGLVKAMRRALENASLFLAIEVPSDTIIVIYYTGPGQAKEITGMNYPFCLGDTLHYWPPSQFGLPVMKYMVHQWQSAGTRHEFITHGLIALLDGSGRNYHRWTLTRYEHGSFLSLSELVIDTNVNCNDIGPETAMAASFVDFVVYAFGVDALSDLYRSNERFDNAVQNVFHMSTDSLQTLWLGTLEQAVKILEESGQ